MQKTLYVILIELGLAGITFLQAVDIGTKIVSVIIMAVVAYYARRSHISTKAKNEAAKQYWDQLTAKHIEEQKKKPNEVILNIDKHEDS